MKSLGLGVLHLTLLLALFACGKNNESGKNNAWSYSNPYGTGLLTGNYSNISYGGVSVNTVINENPCRSGYGGVMSSTGRLPIQMQLSGFPTVIPPGDVYVGVTSYGDVAVLAGSNVGQPPVFVAYMCPRSFAPTGQGQLMGVKIGSYSRCLFKPMTAATMILPGGGSAEFRWMDGGSSMQQRFSSCM